MNSNERLGGYRLALDSETHKLRMDPDAQGEWIRYVVVERLAEELESEKRTSAARNVVIGMLGQDVERLRKAVEFAEYLATAAEAFVKSVNECETHRPGDAGFPNYSGLEEEQADCASALRNAVYEFRKRAERAKHAPAESPSTAEVRRIYNALADDLNKEEFERIAALGPKPMIWVCNPCGGEHAEKVKACARCGSANIRPAVKA